MRQEVDDHNALTSRLKDTYDGEHYSRINHKDGNSTFYKKERFDLKEAVRYQYTDSNPLVSSDRGLISLFLFDKKTNNNLIVANTHLYWDKNFEDVKIDEAAQLCK